MQDCPDGKTVTARATTLTSPTSVGLFYTVYGQDSQKRSKYDYEYVKQKKTYTTSLDISLMFDFFYVKYNPVISYFLKNIQMKQYVRVISQLNCSHTTCDKESQV